MAKPNFSFKKRQREQAKERKRQEKAERKAERANLQERPRVDGDPDAEAPGAPLDTPEQPPETP